MEYSQLRGLQTTKVGLYHLTIEGPCSIHIAGIELSIDVKVKGLTVVPIYLPIPNCLIYLDKPEAYEALTWEGNLLHERAALPYLEGIDAAYVDARHKEIRAVATEFTLTELKGNLLSVSSVNPSKVNISGISYNINGYSILSLPEDTLELTWRSDTPQFCYLAFYYGTISG